MGALIFNLQNVFHSVKIQYQMLCLSREYQIQETSSDLVVELDQIDQHYTVD